MKKILPLLLVLVMLLSLAACGATSAAAPQPAQETPAEAPSQEQPAAESLPVETESPAQAEPAGSSVLVIYFSRTGEQYNVGVIDKGNTAIVAEMIADATGAELYELLPADDHYPMTYKELTDVALQEQREGARPAYVDSVPDLSGYDTIFIGAPVWWGDWPMILYTFFENTPLSGKTLIPFSTHAGSGLSGFDRSLAAAYPECTVAKGLAVAGTDAQNNPERVQQSVSSWLTELGF